MKEKQSNAEQNHLDTGFSERWKCLYRECNLFQRILVGHRTKSEESISSQGLALFYFSWQSMTETEIHVNKRNHQWLNVSHEKSPFFCIVFHSLRLSFAANPSISFKCCLLSSTVRHRTRTAVPHTHVEGQFSHQRTWCACFCAVEEKILA